MTTSLNFNKVKKRWFIVTLNDADNTTLFIYTPTKATLDKFLAMQDLDLDNADMDALDALFDVCAEIMSRNKAGIKITADYLANIFDVEDIVTFITGYTNFLNEVSNQKN